LNLRESKRKLGKEDDILCFNYNWVELNQAYVMGGARSTYGRDEELVNLKESGY
jgi:hypothetical protein